MGDVKGIVGEKVGMTQIFVETRAVPVTVIKAGPCVVAQVRSQGTDGYDAVQLAYGQMRPRDVNRPTKGHFDKAVAEALSEPAARRGCLAAARQCRKARSRTGARLPGRGHAD